jgi:hypothetical protein
MNSQTVVVTVYQPTFAVSANTAICMKGSITLTASGAASYTWTGAPTPSTTFFYQVTPTVATIYTVMATSQPSNTVKCISAKTVSVGIYLQPTVTVAPSRTNIICKGEYVKLYGMGADTYYWPALNKTADTVQVLVTQAVTYQVYGTDIYGCKDTAQIVIKYSTCPGFPEYSKNIQISVFPNPNNGAFTIQAPFAIQLRLVNELGQVVRELKFTPQNNNKISVSDLPPGVYLITGEHEGETFSEKLIIN